MRLGFVGVGRTGRPIALNLVSKGNALTVCSRNGCGVEALRARHRCRHAARADLAGADIVSCACPTPRLEVARW